MRAFYYTKLRGAVIRNKSVSRISNHVALTFASYCQKFHGCSIIENTSKEYTVTIESFIAILSLST